MSRLNVTSEDQGTSNNPRPVVPVPSNRSLAASDRNASAHTLNLGEYIDSRDSGGYQVYPGAEREEYDFTAERLSLYSTNLIESVAHLIKSCLGAGILCIHEGYMFGGLWTSLATTLVLALIVCHTMMILVKSAQYMCVVLRIPKLSYPDLAEAVAAIGPWRGLRKHSKRVRYTVDMWLFIEMCGTCCIYQIMIASTLKQVLEAISPDIRERYEFDVRIYILTLSIPLTALCIVRSLKYLAPFSLLADIFVGVCILTTMYYSLTSIGKITNRPAWKSFHGLIRFSGVCLYSIDGVGVTLPIENNMKKPNYFHVVMQFGMAVVVLSVSTTGFLGYWHWGEDCHSPITTHIPMDSVFPIVLQFLFAIMLSITYAVRFWVPFRIIWCYVGKKHERRRAAWERFYRALLVTLVTLLAAAFPHLIQLMIVLGNLFLSFIAFIFPAIIDCIITRMERQKVSRWNLTKNASIMLLGLILCGSTISSFFVD